MHENGERSGEGFLCRLLFAVVLALTLSAVLACKTPFSTRQAEPPFTSRSRWIPPSQPTDVLENMKDAIAEEHIPNYLGCLSDSAQTGRPFVFVPEPGVAANYGELFNTWSRASEKRYLDQLFQATPRDSLRRLVFANVTERPGEENERVLVADYVLDVHHTLDPASYPRHVEGQAQFWMIQDPKTSYWSIWKWRDSATGEHETWTALKAVFGR